MTNRLINKLLLIFTERLIDSPFFCVKDFTGNDRQKEEKYMERTDEVIYQRAAEEHIRRPPLWHDDEVDSVRVSLFLLCIVVPLVTIHRNIFQFNPF